MLSDDIEDQLKPQGFTLGEHAQMIQRAADNISFSSIHQLLTETEKHRARNRLIKVIQRAVRSVPVPPQ